MRWVTPILNRIYFVLDSGRIVVELLGSSDGVIDIIAVNAGSLEFQKRLKGARFIDLPSAKEFVEREWTVDGDCEPRSDDEID